MDQAIPKIIHYCWFGGRPLPELARKCIASWRRFLPDYEIREWNEANFDVESTEYTSRAHKAGKYAFVSDYVRYLALYRHGGLYFDTDVEIIRPLDDLISRGPFLGIEKTRTTLTINPGLAMGALPGMTFYRDVLNVFEKWHPATDEDFPPLLLIPETTRLMRISGFEEADVEQLCSEIRIYPNEYFNPLDDYTGKLNITANTKSIHHYAKSWIEGYGPLRDRLAKLYHRFLIAVRK